MEDYRLIRPEKYEENSIFFVQIARFHEAHSYSRKGSRMTTRGTIATRRKNPGPAFDQSIYTHARSTGLMNDLTR